MPTLKKSGSPLPAALLLLVLAILLIGAWRCLRSTAPATTAVENPTTDSPPSRGVTAASPKSTPNSKAATTVPGQGTATPLPIRNLLLGGSVVDAKGSAVPLVPVEAFIHDAVRTLTRKTVETDAEGSFKIECPEYSQVTLTAHLQGHGRACFTTQLAGGSRSNPGILTLQLRSGLAFDGTLVLADKTPAADARLRFHPIATKAIDYSGSTYELALINALDPAWLDQCRRDLHLTDCEVQSDAQGRFRAHSLISSTIYAVEVIREGKGRSVIDFFSRVPDSGVKLVLPP